MNRALYSIIFLLFLSLNSYAEYTVGVRQWLGGNMAFGKAGTHFIQAQPFSSQSKAYQVDHTIWNNGSNGTELYGEVSLTRQLYLEAHFGYNHQNKLLYSPGIETTTNGRTATSDNIYIYDKATNLVYGLAIVGKTPGINRSLRFSASFGFQFMNALSNEVSFVTVRNIESEGEIVEGETSNDVTDSGTLSGINPWGFRVLSGLGVDFMPTALRSTGVVLQLAVRFGFDLSYSFFKNQSIAESVQAHAEKTANSKLRELASDRIKKTYIELSGGIYLGALYRLPLGELAVTRKSVPKRRPRNVDEE